MTMPVTLTLTEEQLRVIAAALNELPAKFSHRVLCELEAQVQAQGQQWDQAKWDSTGGKPNG